MSEPNSVGDRLGAALVPEFVDNRDGNTLAAALNARLNHLADTLRQPVDVAIATGYFNPEGFARETGLFLGIDVTDTSRLGACRTPHFTQDFGGRWHFNTSIAAIMELVNELTAADAAIADEKIPASKASINTGKYSFSCDLSIALI